MRSARASACLMVNAYDNFPAVRDWHSRFRSYDLDGACIVDHVSNGFNGFVSLCSELRHCTRARYIWTVSYTHLTLPTNREESSRGLGDVYKRQDLDGACIVDHVSNGFNGFVSLCSELRHCTRARYIWTVSYTHLTLPTNREV